MMLLVYHDHYQVRQGVDKLVVLVCPAKTPYRANKYQTGDDCTATRRDANVSETMSPVVPSEFFDHRLAFIYFFA